MAKPIKTLELQYQNDSVFYNSVYHMQISLLNQKTVSTLIWFWQVICVHTNLIRLETVKKNVYLDKFRNDATMTFCSKISFFLFLKVIPMLKFF